jgi:hypothetical protein
LHIPAWRSMKISPLVATPAGCMHMPPTVCPLLGPTDRHAGQTQARGPLVLIQQHSLVTMLDSRRSHDCYLVLKWVQSDRRSPLYQHDIRRRTAPSQHCTCFIRGPMSSVDPLVSRVCNTPGLRRSGE